MKWTVIAGWSESTQLRYCMYRSVQMDRAHRPSPWWIGFPFFMFSSCRCCAPRLSLCSFLWSPLQHHTSHLLVTWLASILDGLEARLSVITTIGVLLVISGECAHWRVSWVIKYVYVCVRVYTHWLWLQFFIAMPCGDHVSVSGGLT